MRTRNALLLCLGIIARARALVKCFLKKIRTKSKNVGAASPEARIQRGPLPEGGNQKCTAEETPARVGVIRLTLRARVDRRAPRPLFERFVIIPHFFAFVKCSKPTIFRSNFR